MARIRSIKPEFRTSLTVTSWPRDVRLFFALLWGYLDDFGRGVDEPRLIKADCFPLDEDITAATIDEWLDLLAKTETLVRYTVAGKRFLSVPDWPEHQKPQHPRPSKVPPPERADSSGRVSDEPEDLPDFLMSDSCVTHEYVTPEGEGRGGEWEEERERDNTSSSATADAVDDDHESNDGEAVDDQAAETTQPDRNDRADVQGLCRLLADLMIENGCKPPPITKKWLDEARCMIDRDGREPAKAAHLIEWSQRHHFWKSNIQSMPTFRAKYDILRLQAMEEWQGQRGGRNGRRDVVQTVTNGVDLARRLHEQEQAEEAEVQQALIAIPGGRQ